MERLEERLALSGNYVSPYAITGLNPAYTQDIGTLTTQWGRLYAAETTTLPNYSASGTNAWYQMSNYYPLASGPDVQGVTWGPQPYLLPRPALPAGIAANTFASVQFYEQRIIATAEALIGTPYQHHHDALWDSYTSQPNWPWNPVSNNNTSEEWVPRQQPDGTWQLVGNPFPNPYYPAYDVAEAGIDCSDLTALAYNVGAGIFINSAVGEQALINAQGQYIGTSPLGWNNSASPTFVNPGQSYDALITPITPQIIPGPNFAFDAGRNIDYVTTWNKPGSLDSVIDQLQPGDLLYIANNYGPTPAGALPTQYHEVMHVVIWLGQYATGPDGNKVPLVISSHDNTPAVLDANGQMPPPGVQILPFDPSSWFYQNFSFAARLLPTLQMSSVTASAPTSPGSPVTFTATFTLSPDSLDAPPPTGTVTFTDGSQVLGSTTTFVPGPVPNTYLASFTVNGLAPGAHAIAATYSGDANFPGSIGHCTLTVSPPAPPNPSPGNSGPFGLRAFLDQWAADSSLVAQGLASGNVNLVLLGLQDLQSLLSNLNTFMQTSGGTFLAQWAENSSLVFRGLASENVNLVFLGLENLDSLVSNPFALQQVLA